MAKSSAMARLEQELEQSAGNMDAEFSEATLESTTATLDDRPSLGASLTGGSYGGMVAGPCCEKCGAPGQDSSDTWCRQCGYYGRLGTYVELDESDRIDPRLDELEQSRPAPTALTVWKLVPPWAWKLAAAVLAVAALSLVGRLMTADGSKARLLWALAQLGVGFAAFFVAHVSAYLMAAMHNDKASVLDPILRPIGIWIPSIRELPRALWRVTTGSCAVTAIFTALVVVDGIDYEEIWTWGPSERAKVNLVQAVSSMRDERAGANEELADSVEKFAKDGSKAAGDSSSPKIAEIKRNLRADCLIVGFTPLSTDETDFASLIVATSVQGELRMVGKLREGIPPEVRDELNRRMRQLERSTPFVDCKYTAVWVQPRLTCRVRFSSWTNTKRVVNPLFDTMLAELQP